MFAPTSTRSGVAGSKSWLAFSRASESEFRFREVPAGSVDEPRRRVVGRAHGRRGDETVRRIAKLHAQVAADETIELKGDLAGDELLEDFAEVGRHAAMLRGAEQADKRGSPSDSPADW